MLAQRFLNQILVPALSTVSILTLISGCSSAPANTGPQSDLTTTEETDQAAAGQGISRAEWLQYLPQSMSEEFCGEQHELRSCYPKANEECEHQVQQVTLNCAQTHQSEIPALLQSEAQDDWGTKLGDCAQDAMIQAQVTKAPECVNALGQNQQAGTVAQ